MCSTYHQREMQKAIPAIVISDPPKRGAGSAPLKFEDIVTIQEYQFDVALRRVIGRQNSRAGVQYLTLRKESRFEWTIMGTQNCEYILVTLDPLYAFFTVSSLLPVTAEVVEWFSGAMLDYDIELALSKLFAR